MQFSSTLIVSVFFLFFSFPHPSFCQTRLGYKNRTSTAFIRSTTTLASVEPVVTTGKSGREFENPSLTLPARSGQFFVFAFSHNDFLKSIPENKTTINAVRDRYGFGVRATPDPTDAQYEYTAAIHGKPDLPSWLNLASTPSDGDTNKAFLYGTPEKEESVEDIMILARNLATNDVLQKLIRIQVRDDKRYSSPVKQIAEVWIENFDAWELLSSASSTSTWSSDLSNVRPSNTSINGEDLEDSLLDELRYAISRVFRGRGVRPYIRDLKPATQVGARRPSTKDEKEGLVVYVGTQNEFSSGLRNLAAGLKRNWKMCNRSEIIQPNSNFAPIFQVNWCKFEIRNATEREISGTTLLIDGQQIRRGSTAENRYDDVAYISELDNVRHYEPVARQRDYSWEWVMVAVVPLAILLVLVLILSAVFFGCREGQHWRDYKTPRDQLNEYVNLRRTQQRLRLLSHQRQSVDILDATEEQPVPVQLPRRPMPPSSPTLSLGKQTVAQAAAVRGSNIELYKDTDSFDEREQLLAGARAGTYPKQQHEIKDGHQGQRRTSYDDQRMLITRDSSV